MKAIDDYIRKNNTTQAALAEKMGMSRQTFSLKASGKRPFLLSEAFTLADILGCDVNDFRDEISRS